MARAGQPGKKTPGAWAISRGYGLNNLARDPDRTFPKSRGPGHGPKPLAFLLFPLPLTASHDEKVHDKIQHEDERAEHDVIPAGIGRIEPGAEYVVLKKSFFVWLNSAHPPEAFFPWGEGAPEIEEHRKHRPDDRGNVNPQQCGPDQNEQGAEHDENNVARVRSRDSAGEQPPRHFVAVRSKCGFSMMPI